MSSTPGHEGRQGREHPPSDRRTVKRVTERVGLPARTVRYYDVIGLVSAAERSEAGYRLYTPEEEAKLRFVRRARGIGLSLEEIRRLLRAAERGGPGEVIPELERLLGDKVSEIDRRIADLSHFRRRLVDFRAGRGLAAVVRDTRSCSPP